MVSFLITGIVSLGAESTAEEGSTQWHKEQAQKYLAGIKDGTEITLGNDITAGETTISSDNAGGIKITFSDKEITVSKEDISSLTGEVIQNSLNLINGEKISKITDVDGYNEGFSLNNVGEIEEGDISVTISGEGDIFVNEGTLEKGQIASNSATIVNKGKIISNDPSAQKIETGTAYNYGIIANKNNYGQYIKNGTGYNYGIISNIGNYGQAINGESSMGYNYGIISNIGTHGQNISGKEANGYNYGIINLSLIHI